MSGAGPADGPGPDVERTTAPAGEPAPAPAGVQRRAVRVRRSPRIGVFLALGAALGAVVALFFISITPADPQVPTPQALGFLVLLLAPLGALITGTVAVAIDRVGERRARIVQAEHTRGIGDDD